MAVETARAASKEGVRRDPIRVGVIGSGSVARKYIPHMQRMNIPRQRVDIAVVCDPDRAPVGRCQGALRPRHVHPRLPRSVWPIPSIDLVLVLTSMQQHGEIAQAALEAGKHVLVEKPMAMTLPEAAELVELAGAQSRLPGLRAARRPQPDLSGDLAAVCSRAPSARSSPRAASTAGPARAGGSGSTSPGGGAMFDLGVYNVTTLTGLLGPAQAGDGHERHRHPGAGRRRRADPGRHARQRPSAARLRRRLLRRGHDRVHDPALQGAGHRALRHRGHDPDDRRGLGAAPATRCGRTAPAAGRSSRTRLRLALDRRHPPHDRVHRDRDRSR